MVASSEKARSSDVVPLVPLGNFFRRFRRVFLCGLSGLLLVGFALVGFTWWLTPATQIDTLSFSLTFRGAQDGKYPNGLPFSVEEMLDGSILQNVYDRHQLSQWLGFDDFRESISVSAFPGDFHKMRKLFESQLIDSSLSGPDRRRLEDQYLSRLQTGASGLYELSWFDFCPPQRRVPSDVKAKVLVDIPALWAERALKIKQVLFFPVGIPGPTARFEGQPLKTLADLDSRSRMLDETLESISRLPGGDQASIQGGINLADLRLRLRAFREQDLPLARQAFLAGIQDPSDRLFVEKTFNMQLQTREQVVARTQGRLKALLETYQDYLAGRPGTSSDLRSTDTSEESPVVPLLSDESFLGRLLDLTQGGTDRGYRQKIIGDIDAARKDVGRAERVAADVRQDLVFFQSTGSRSLPRVSAGGLQTPSPSVDRVFLSGGDVAGLVPTANLLDGILESSRAMLAEISGKYLDRDVNLFEISGLPKVRVLRGLPVSTLAVAFLSWLSVGGFALGLVIWGYSKIFSLRRSALDSR